MSKKPLYRANGTGSITKLSGRRRKPYIARWTMGTDEDTGKQIRKTVGTYETRAEAEAALYSYKENPYDLDAGKATFAEVYETWSKSHYPEISEATSHNYANAYNKCTFLHNKKLKDIKLDDLIFAIESSNCNYPVIKIIKSLFNQIYKYAVPRHLCSEDLTVYLDISKYKSKNPNSQKRERITDDEIEKIWQFKDTDIGKVVLMIVYSGVRIAEMLNLKKEDCHLDERYVSITHAKTDAGIRKVPISEKTIDFWLYFFNANNESEYLIYINDRDFHGNSSLGHAYKRFLDSYWSPFFATLGIYKTQKKESTKTPHEARYSCVSMLQEANVSEAAIKAIVGHQPNDVTQAVYTQLSIEYLLECINKI